ncbi:Protein of unknown function (Hypoth_ymh) [Plantibacter flavus]|uniref:Uncharacterized protein Ymh n=1 Tax=Plantibacter flavus TaxID=150123 RepID=A0A3N2C6T9_9MICO|nr:TIGR02391 family protein [Plantibacter flavus]ROR83243.1 uncharacterized protein Ymh [Plantibacter flavus]SMG21800.1 Protein of unknown function (Hypoth_ymh) [Plantibacter flavus]
MSDAATQWMVDHLQNHLNILENSGFDYATQVEGMDVSRRIIERVLPDEPFNVDVYDEGWKWQARTFISKALGVLRNQAELLEFLGPGGPSMQADRLHPVVWGAAAELWKIEHFRAAVARAATFLNAHIQDKSTRTDVSDKELMTQVFSDHAPKADQPRLRWSGAGSLQTRKAMGSGLLAYAQGISLAIRNPATHETQEMPRQMAFEQLTALSLLARWVDECQLAQAEDGA